jgi:hypothetical protein
MFLPTVFHIEPNYSSITIDNLNKCLSRFIHKLISDGQINIKSTNPKEAKVHFDLLQKFLLIVNSERTHFLIDYCKYVNMDLLTLELEFKEAKIQKDKKNLFFISQAYRMNSYDEITKADFDDVWYELADKYEYYKIENIFSKANLKKLNWICRNNSHVFLLNPSCMKH